MAFIHVSNNNRSLARPLLLSCDLDCKLNANLRPSIITVWNVLQDLVLTDTASAKPLPEVDDVRRRAAEQLGAGASAGRLPHAGEAPDVDEAEIT